MSLHLVSHPLPTAWDGREIKWGRWQSPPPALIICGRKMSNPCDCGSDRLPFTAVGLRAADVGPGRFARRHALRDIHAFRCADCGQVDVWDMDTDEWWTLDDSDYGPQGSHRPTNAK